MSHNPPLLKLDAEDFDYLDEHMPLLQTLATLNGAYRKNRLRPTAEDELARIFKKEDGTRWKNAARDRRIAQMNVRIQSRVLQMLGDVDPEELDRKAPGNPLWAHPEDRRGLTEGEFRRAPRTKAKTTEELFANRHDRKGVTGDDKIGLLSLDPGRVSEHALRSFDMRQYIGPRNTPQERRLQLAAQAVPNLKKMLRDMQPLARFADASADTIDPVKSPHEFNHRNYVMKGGVNDGRLLVTHRKKDDDKTFQVLSLPEAARRLVRIDIQQRTEELAVLERVQALLTTILGFARDKNWAEVKKDPRLARTLGELDDQLADLIFVENPHKEAIRDALLNLRLDEHGQLQTGVLGDAKGKTNPLIAGDKIEEILKSTLFRDRAKEIEGISGNLSRDDRIIFEANNRMKGVYTDFKHFLEDNAQSEGAFLRGKDVEEVRRAITAFKKSFEKTNLEPYKSFSSLILTYFEQALKELNEVETVLGNDQAAHPGRLQRAVLATRTPARLEGDGRSDGADKLATPRQHLTTAYVAVKAQQITSELLTMCADIALFEEYGEHFSLSILEKRLNTTQGLLNERKLARGYYPREFNPLWEKFRRMVDQLRVQVATAQEAQNPQEKAKLLENIKEDIKAFVSKNVISYIKNIAGFRKDAKVDEDGNVYKDIAFLDFEFAQGKAHIPPAFMPQDGRPLTAAQQEAASAQLGNEAEAVQVACVVKRFQLDRGSGHIRAVKKPVAEFSSLVKPPRPIDKVSEGVHNISDADVAHAPTMKECLDTLAPILREVHAVAGHNVTTDLALLLTEAARAEGLPDSTPLSAVTIPEWFPRAAYCTSIGGKDECQLVDKKTGLFRFPALPELYKRLFGEDMPGLHNGTADVQATMRCFVELVRRGQIRLGEPNTRVTRALKAPRKKTPTV